MVTDLFLLPQNQEFYLLLSFKASASYHDQSVYLPIGTFENALAFWWENKQVGTSTLRHCRWVQVLKDLMPSSN